jgi:hypothetical protein
MIKFYDSATPADIPQGATHAALYADGKYAVTNIRDVVRIPHRRFITVTGDHAHAGIADYEHGNPVYDVPGKLREWASRRLALDLVPPVVYVDRADLHLALAQMGQLPHYYWIPTLDNHEWTPDDLSADIWAEHHVHVPAHQIWANQYTDHANLYDESNLFLRWFI